MSAKGFEPHDHSVCIADLMQHAQTQCDAAGARLTPVRRRVLEILLEDHRALGAYDILEQLAEEGLGTKPPVVYRALDFLTEQGLAHKIERLKAYTACTHPGQCANHAPAFLVCRDCHAVSETELDLADAPMRSDAEGTGFRIERIVVEAEGLCPACQDTPHG